MATLNDDDGSRRMRVLTPAEGFVSDDGLAAIAPWPYLYERALGTGARDKASAWHRIAQHSGSHGTARHGMAQETARRV